MRFQFPAQYDYHRGPDAIGQHKFTFDVDESIIDQVGELMKTKKGTQFMMTLSQIDEEKIIDKDLIQETPEESKERFFKRFHSLIGQVAEMRDKKPEEIKEKIKKRLIREKVITESTKEMSIDQLALEIGKLEEILK